MSGEQPQRVNRGLRPYLSLTSCRRVLRQPVVMARSLRPAPILSTHQAVSIWQTATERGQKVLKKESPRD